ncbi:benzoate 4-monooxygenase cytochrome P450 [Colletotrichum orchidophilum]|uniref:Benzoate 4-monooxygenase cytochrome P450 n=1 Tax=Colletotrichum orchidophilum TaxID=1209926 RepID=A0A1G4AZC8_9PEZI|nr:benzoate 4-monooxygenase cytochrome P450 [Colletotrichum orchidophilum]OHE94392.1 benzoate 4-monooxygenase cytochrome P450 [Colletotrichum orchidophilum]
MPAPQSTTLTSTPFSFFFGLRLAATTPWWMLRSYLGGRKMLWLSTAGREQHGYRCKLFAHGFLERAMRVAEGVWKAFVDVLFCEAWGGIIFLLTESPRVLAELATDGRSIFSQNLTQTRSLIFTDVNTCKYLLACIEEALSVYPPSPQPHHRIVPPGGATVDGVFLSG